MVVEARDSWSQNEVDLLKLTTYPDKARIPRDLNEPGLRSTGTPLWPDLELQEHNQPN